MISNYYMLFFGDESWIFNGDLPSVCHYFYTVCCYFLQSLGALRSKGPVVQYTGVEHVGVSPAKPPQPTQSQPPATTLIQQLQQRPQPQLIQQVQPSQQTQQTQQLQIQQTQQTPQPSLAAQLQRIE